jgi:hypothetical protein
VSGRVLPFEEELLIDRVKREMRLEAVYSGQHIVSTMRMLIEEAKRKPVPYLPMVVQYAACARRRQRELPPEIAAGIDVVLAEVNLLLASR